MEYMYTVFNNSYSSTKYWLCNGVNNYKKQVYMGMMKEKSTLLQKDSQNGPTLVTVDW